MTDSKENLTEGTNNPSKISPWNQPCHTVVIRVPQKLKEKLLKIAHVLDDTSSLEDLKLISITGLQSEIDSIVRAKKSYNSSFKRLKDFIDNLDS